MLRKMWSTLGFVRRVADQIERDKHDEAALRRDAQLLRLHRKGQRERDIVRSGRERMVC